MSKAQAPTKEISGHIEKAELLERLKVFNSYEMTAKCLACMRLCIAWKRLNIHHHDGIYGDCTILSVC